MKGWLPLGFTQSVKICLSFNPAISVNLTGKVIRVINWFQTKQKHLVLTRLVIKFGECDQRIWYTTGNQNFSINTKYSCYITNI